MKRNLIITRHSTMVSKRNAHLKKAFYAVLLLRNSPTALLLKCNTAAKCNDPSYTFSNAIHLLFLLLLVLHPALLSAAGN